MPCEKKKTLKDRLEANILTKRKNAVPFRYLQRADQKQMWRKLQGWDPSYSQDNTLMKNLVCKEEAVVKT